MFGLLSVSAQNISRLDENTWAVPRHNADCNVSPFESHRLPFILGQSMNTIAQSSSVLLQWVKLSTRSKFDRLWVAAQPDLKLEHREWYLQHTQIRYHWIRDLDTVFNDFEVTGKLANRHC